MIYFFGPGHCADCWIDNVGNKICTMNCSGRTTTSFSSGRGGDAGPGPAECSTAHSQTVSRTLLEVAYDLSQIKRHNQNYLVDSRYVMMNVPRKLMEELDQIVRRYSNHLPNS